MNHELQISYENIGTSSYLTIVLSADNGLIEYQLEMLAANEISHILPVSKRMLNGETLAYYNITSKIPLSQVLNRRKLKREEMIRIIKGAVHAIRDAKEYQLPMEGLVMEAEYIFVDPATCDPGFLFLPVRRVGENGLKEFVVQLVMQGKIEMSSDNFVQILLETVNREPLSLDSLEKCVESFSASRTSGRTSAAGPIQHTGQGVERQPVIFDGSANQNIRPSQSIQPEMERPVSAPEVSAAVPVPPLPEKKADVRTKKKADKKVGKKAEKLIQKAEVSNESEEESGFDPEKAKKQFMLPQAVIMVALSAAVSFGFFTDEAGALVLNNILAVAILVVVTEVILYREAYVNSKKPKKSKKNKKNTKTSKVAVPKMDPGSRSVPVPKPVPGPKPVPVQKPAPSQRPAPEEAKAVSQPAPRPILQPQPPQKLQAASSMFSDYSSGFEDTDMDGATELFDGSMGGMSAYLEYYDNGMVTRIPLDKQSVLIGRLQGQVDFAVSNPRVGKIHAEFTVKDNHYYVTDINSKNGTYVNSSTRINSNVPYLLHDNDRIRLADSEFTLRCSS